jgi:putative peptidoglycan lipid II flippase
LGVFAIAVSTAVLPSLSSQAVQNDTEKFQETLGYSLRMVFFIILPSMAGLLVLGEPITRILFERFKYDAQSTAMTTQALFYYTLGLWAFSAIRVLPNVFFASQDTKTPVKAAFASIIINIILSLLLMGPMKHGGLALALSISSALQMFMLLYFIRRKIGAGFLLNVISSAFRSFIAASIMALIVYFIRSNWLTVARDSKMSIQIIDLACLIVIGFVSFAASARLVGCTEYKAVKEMAFPGRGNVKKS